MTVKIERNVCNLGDRLAAEDSERVAIVDCRIWDSPRTRTYGELEREASCVARFLLDRGFSPGTAIGIVSENRSEYITAFLGILRAGMVAVPISHRFPSTTIDYIVRDASIKFAFHDAQSAHLLPSTFDGVDFDASGGGGFTSVAQCSPVETRDMPEDAIALILYTSGSTGVPKGVPLTHGGHLWVLNLRLDAMRAQGRQKVLVVAPLFHMNALMSTLFTLAAGSTEILLPRFDARQVVEAIDRHRCDLLSLVPTMMALILRQHDALAKADLSSIKHIRLGSAPVSDSLWDDTRKLFPNAKLQNAYGTTEAGPVVFGFGPQGRIPPRKSVGWPLAGMQVRLVDEQGRDADEGVLWMRSPANSPGYLHLPDRSAQVFKDGWYVSGDIFRRDAEGAYYFVGRADDMFVCGGENIYPSDVETVLERHPGVFQACVVAVADEIKGEKPFAFIVRRAGNGVTEAEIRDFALQNMPAYQHPRSVEFVDELPSAGPGKLDRKSLTARAEKLWASRRSASS